MQVYIQPCFITLLIIMKLSEELENMAKLEEEYAIRLDKD